MAPFKSSTEYKYRKAVNQVKRYIEGVKVTSNIVDELSALKGMFNRIIRQDQWDWFTVDMYFDYPDNNDVYEIVNALIGLRKAILLKDEKLGTRSIDQLKQANILKYCANFLTYHNGTDSEVEYLYILSRREDKDLLKIGMTTRNIVKRVNEINSATGVLYPYSARKVYKVKDSRRVEKDVHVLLDKYRVRADREFFKIQYHDACMVIENYLKKMHFGYYDNDE